MENWQMEMEDKLDEVIEKVNGIYTALVGNELNRGMGIIDRLSNVEKTVEKLNTESNKIKTPNQSGVGGGASTDPNTPGNKGQDQSLEQPS